MVTRITTLKRLCLSAFVLLIGALPVTAQALTELTAVVDQNPVLTGQSFTLQVTANDSVDSNALDTSALQADFAVGRTSVSSSTQIVNFDMQRQTTWTILLLPKAAGAITLPALEIDGVRSAPIPLTVLNPDQAGEAAPLPMAFIETELEREWIYPGQPTLLTVTLFLGAELQRGSLNAPEHANAQLQQFGQDESDTVVRRGMRYRTIKRQFLLTAQVSGTLELGSASFDGDLLVPGQRGDIFGRAQARSMVATSDPIVVNVMEKPASYQGAWLVADMVALSDHLGDAEQFEVGQPITRTLQLTAMGTVADTLPELALSAPAGLRLYPDKVERDGGVREQQLVATLRQTVALVPSAPGSYTLPEIRVPWWNPRLKRQEWAVLAERTIEVQPSSTGLAPVGLPTPVIQPQTHTEPNAGYWPWLTAVFALLWLLTLVWGWRRGHPMAQPISQQPVNTDKVMLSKKALLQACANHDASQALNLLPRWASEHLGHPVSLARIPHHLPTLSEAIAALQHCRFGATPAPWQGQALAQAIQALPAVAVDAGRSDLPPLDPTSRMSG
ncbi:BatD family protein [Ferrimonas pelagia]|uniref:BatD family protein n=1 Tax=Ferrimonas pelagia TaxID=1177826 RepID=A0ABP9E8Q5_9GAMM